MKHRVSREMYAYWNARRGVRLAPDRCDIDPASIRAVLGDCFMLNRQAGSAPAFRLAGTRVCDLFDRELKGSSFLDLWESDSHAEVLRLLDLMATATQGFLAGATASAVDGDTIALELLLLPLHRAGTAEARSIGTLAPLTPGRFTLPAGGALRLDGWRYVGPEIEDIALPRFMDIPEGAEIRRGMFVIAGGGK